MAPALDRGDDDSAEPHARTPAQRYAEFRDRQATPELASFRALYGFEFDDFQVRACTALNAGSGVLVAAPTGSGKTVVGEFAVHLALERGLKCFYTTPIKALSNQKYADLVRRYDSRTVGLLTGDNSVNGEAPIVVMTTEVLRNMLYAGSATLKGLGYVVLDEVHYLADRSRGAVWEEVIIHLPESVRLVALSATVSNAEEFGDWLDDLRGGVTVIVDEHRPVPLWQHMMAGNRLYDLFTDPAGTRVNPELMRMAQRDRCGAAPVPATGRSRPAAAAGAVTRAAGPGRGGHGPARDRPPGPVPVPARGHRPARRGGPAAGHRVHLQPGGLRRRRAAVPGRRAAAHPARRGRHDHRVRRAADRGHPRRGPGRARLRGMAHRPAAGHRRPPRRDAAHLQGGRRGAVLGRPGPGGVRDRDAGPGHQHARPGPWSSRSWTSGTARRTPS